MKSFIVAVVLVALASFAMAYDDEKRFFLTHECDSNNECPVGKCCRGKFKRTCKDYIREGDRCYFAFMTCGCEPGTSCKLVPKAGVGVLPAFICARDEEGSGIDENEI